MIIYELSKKDYLEAWGTNIFPWYGLPRGFVLSGDIYINKDAFFLDDRDKYLLISHEQGHIDGKDHTWFGVMSAYGLIRYLTSFKYSILD